MSFLAGQSRKADGKAVVPTYRHLLSPQAMTPMNPLRCIAHCDIDAAYAQFEQVRLGLPDDVPLICAQWQSIIAVNYPARKFGIKRFTTITEAKKMCPELVVQHVATYRNGESEAGYWGEVDSRTHKVSLDPYRRESLKILAIFKEMVPRGEIEKASIDEAFLDLTPMAIEKLLEAHPYLATVPADAPNGLDSPLPPAPPINWSKAGNVFPVNGESAGDTGEGEVAAEGGSVSGSQEDEGSDTDGGRRSGDNWEDWALCMGGEIMWAVRAEVFKRLHYTCSAGIAHNKSMAKLCSAWKKPGNQTILRSSATPAFLQDREFTDIRSLGGKLGAAIASEFDAKTVGDMLSVSLEDMQRRFGEESIWVYNILRGIDHSEVKERVASKSMLASKNVRPAVTTPQQGYHWLSVLAGELNVRLRESREAIPGLWPKTLVLGHRQGSEPSRSRQCPFPFTRNLTTEYIVKYAKKLWDESTEPMKNGNMKLHNISIGFTGLEKLEEGQQGIEGFFANPKPAPPGASSDNASAPKPKRPLSPPPSTADEPVKKPRPPPPASIKPTKPKSALESFFIKQGEASTSRSVSPSLPPADASSGEGSSSRPLMVEDFPQAEGIEGEEEWVCPKCQSRFSVPEGFGLEDERAEMLRGLRQEHGDWHFAMSLQDGGGTAGGTSGVQSSSGAGKVKKKKRKPEGIKAFFAPKPQ
ncbi:hypothetical protein IAT38_004007 [Cryptococcus sp. DSM 104549]